MRPQLEIPTSIRPADGRFGSGPSKVRQEAVERLAAAAPTLLGTSHRKAPVKSLVARVREGLATFFDLPSDHLVALGNGGATAFWDVAAFNLIGRRSAHAVFGEFSSKFAASVAACPFLDDPVLVASEHGTHPALTPLDGVDAYALTHCETSTGVAMPVVRPAPAAEALTLVDATSAAGGLPVDPGDYDAYYFSPQKGFGSDGGLWIALLSPAALERLEAVRAGDRHVPPSLDLLIAVENSRQEQTYNTPAIATLFLMAEQIDWLNERGGLKAAVAECAAKAEHIYRWAEDRSWATPFVTSPQQRSDVVCTIDLDEAVPADDVNRVLRANGIVDTDAYRKLGRNQLRIAVFPAVDRHDAERLTASIDYVVDHLGG